MNKKTILVTGANGQLGQEIKRLASKAEDLHFVYTDVKDFDITNNHRVREYITDMNPFAVINCAAYTAVDKAETEPEKAALINVAGPGSLAAACALTDSLFIHISTDYVFGGVGNTPYLEDYPVDPKGVYAVTKAHGEQAVISSGCDYMIVRTSWLYSEYGYNFVKTMLRLGKEREEITVVDDQIGSPTYAADLAQTLIDVLQHEGVNYEMHDVFHYANQGAVSWYEFAQEIMNYAKLNCKVHPISTENYPMPAPRPAYSVLETSKIRKTFGVEIPNWKESLHACIDRLLI